MTFLFHQLGAAFSIQFAGIMHDVTGRYDEAFAVVASLLIIAAISSFRVKEREYSARYQVRPQASASAAG
jgi:cyanate permease